MRVGYRVGMVKTRKKILITVSEGSIARNILRSFVLEELLKAEKTDVALLVPADKEQIYREEFGSERVKVLKFNPPRRIFFNKIIVYLARNGFRTETILTDQKTRLLIDKKYLSFAVKRAIAIIFGRCKIFHKFVRFLSSLKKPSGEITSLLAKLNPDLIFATDVLDELDVDVMRAALRMRVKVIGMVRSWDNLSSHGLVHIVPDLLIVWNPYLKQKAIFLHHIPEEKIVITGIPHYDWYKKPEIIISRQEFLEQFGIDTKKKIVLFAGIGEYLAVHEAEVAEILANAIASKKIVKDAVVLFRPHPNFAVSQEERLHNLANLIFDRGVADYTSKEKSSWEMDKKKISHLVNSLYHADLVVTTASTMTMDAVSFNKPVVCVAFDGFSQEPYWHSVARYYRDFTHYRDITRTKGFKLAYSAEDLIKAVNSYLERPEQDSEGRKKIMEEFIWKLDGQSAKRVADVLIKALD